MLRRRDHRPSRSLFRLRDTPSRDDAGGTSGQHRGSGRPRVLSEKGFVIEVAPVKPAGLKTPGAIPG
jgi:hypothetical protein